MLLSSTSFTSFIIFGFLWVVCLDSYYHNTLDAFNKNVLLFFLVVASLVSYVSYDFLKSKVITKFEYDILFLFAVVSGCSICFADDLFVIYLAIELQSLTFFVLASFNRNSEYSTESGLKYFVFGAIISCVLLFGFVLTYLSFGVVSFEFFNSLSVSSLDITAFPGFLLILITLFFKLGVFPFHFWLCDVYEGSILTVTLLFSSLPKLVMFALLVKFVLFSLTVFTSSWNHLMLFSALGSIILGSVSAIFQKRVKRLFAYSAISHTGTMLFAVLIMTTDSMNALFFYLIIYALLTILTFSVLIFSSVSCSIYPKYLISWVSINMNNVMFSLTFVFILFSIAGIPPVAGFFTKFFVLASAVAENYLASSIAIVIVSSIACFYYLRFIKVFLFTKDLKNSLLWLSTSKTNTELVISTLLIFNVFFLIFSSSLLNFSSILGLILF